MYNEFYILLEQIYAGIYNENQNECDQSERNESPQSENYDEPECIELDTFDTTDDPNIINEIHSNNNTNDKSLTHIV